MSSLAAECRQQQMMAADTEVKKEVEQPASVKKDLLSVQYGGNHYVNMKIQPIEFFLKNSTADEIFGALRKDVTKYIWRRKGKPAARIEDLKKAIHLLEFYVAELESRL